MKRLSLALICTLFSAAWAQTTPNYWPRCWKMKTDLIGSIDQIKKDPIREKLGVTPLFFLWVTGGKSSKLMSLDALAEVFHRVRPSLGSVQFIKHALIEDLYVHWSSRSVVLNDPETSIQYFENLIYEYNAQFPDQGHKIRVLHRDGGLRVEVDLVQDAFERAGADGLATRQAAYQVRFEEGALKINLIEGGNLHFSLDEVLRAPNEPFRIQQVDGAFDFFDRILRVNNIGADRATERDFAYRLLDYLSQRKIGQTLFDALTDDELLRLLARDMFTYRYLQRVYASTAGHENSLEAILKAARYARNVRFAIIVGSAAAIGTAVWQLWPDTETEKLLKHSLSRVPQNWRTTPDKDVVATLRDLIESTDSNEALAATIKGLGCDTAYTLWNYVFEESPTLE